MSYIAKMRKQSEWFDDKTLSAGAKLYDIPLKVYSIRNTTPYFDILIEANTDIGNQKHQLIIFNEHDNHFTVLLDKK
jgi:hypothetical protein